MELLNMDKVKKIYNMRLGLKQCTALNGVSFEVSKGEFVAVMGPSGSGKTTILNLIAALDRPTVGDVYLEGKAFREIKDRELSAFRRDNLGFVFQEFNLLDTFSIKDNILLPLVLSKMPISVMEGRLLPVAHSLGIEDLLEKYPYEISGGEKQRAAVARAIITHPKLLLADEPTGALDSKSAANLLDIFVKLNREGQTIVMVTHSAMAASRAQRILFIRDGEIFSQLYRGESTDTQLYDRIAANLAVLESGERSHA